MFQLLDKFILLNNTLNVNKIYKSITFSLFENFDDQFLRETISTNLKSTIVKMGLSVNTLIVPLLTHYKQVKFDTFIFSTAD